jgi:hypothetical protein
MKRKLCSLLSEFADSFYHIKDKVEKKVFIERTVDEIFRLLGGNYE